MRYATLCSRSIGRVGSTPSFGSASRAPVNTVPPRRKMPWLLSAAWPGAGLTSTSPPRSIGWACPPAWVRPGQHIGSALFAVCVASMPTVQRKKKGEWLAQIEAAKAPGVSSHMIRRLVSSGVLPAVQVVPRAPFQIRAADLASETVKTAIARKGCPSREIDADTLPMFTST